MKYYVDGGCAPTNPGPGGWSVYGESPDGPDLELYGGELLTTNNRMELISLIKALELYQEGDTIYADSDYARLGATVWIHNWKKTNWKNGSVKNQDLWETIDALMIAKNATITRVAGHSGDEGNDKAHELVAIARSLYGQR